MDQEQRRAMLAAFATLAQELEETYGYSDTELIATFSKKDAIPATAFASALTPFETACRYLEEKRKTVKETAKILGRAPSVIEKTLQQSRKKETTLIYAETKYSIPAKLFSDKTRTFSEHLCLHLKQQGLTNAEISRLIGLDPRTVWTVLSRAKKRGVA